MLVNCVDFAAVEFLSKNKSIGSIIPVVKALVGMRNRRGSIIDMRLAVKTNVDSSDIQY